MTDEVPADDLSDLLDRLSPEARRALVDRLRSDPEAVERFLVDGDERADETDVLAEDAGATSPSTEEALEALNETQRELYECLQDLQMPSSRSEVRSFLEDEHPEFLEAHRSATHETWLSQQLKTLMQHGLVGRYRHGREMKYTPSLEEAVQNWLLLNRPLEDDLSLDDTDEIAQETGMPWRVVRRTIDGILDD
jgi:hypothetical protein